MLSFIKSMATKLARAAGYTMLSTSYYETLRNLQRTRTAERIIAHPPVKGLPSSPLVKIHAVDNPKRIDIAKRLLSAYEKASADERLLSTHRPAGDLWEGIVASEFRVLHELLREKDAAGLSQYLLHFGEQYTWFGGLTLSLDGYTPSKDPKDAALAYVDKLVCFAEAVGVLPQELPEGGEWGKNLYCNLDEIIDKVEAELGISITPPDGAIPLTGIATGKGVFHYRHINGLYLAWRIWQLAGSAGAVCEYGGGLGLAALYARRFGLTNYTILDLPLTNVFAGHFLMNALSPDIVSLYGEEARKDTINVLPYWRILEVPARSFDVSANQDSFPEIEEEMVRFYLREIARTTNRYFLSINQEGQRPEHDRGRLQLLVSSLMKLHPQYQRISRSKCWVREGYVEEVYNCDGQSSSAKAS